MSRQSNRTTDGKKMNSELFTLTYGALVTQLCKDYENDEEVNKQLDKMGYNIGVRLIEDFLARSSIGRCQDFRETADVIAKVTGTSLSQSEHDHGTLPEKRGKGEERGGRKDEERNRQGKRKGQGEREREEGEGGGERELGKRLREGGLRGALEMVRRGRVCVYSNLLCGVLRGALEMVQMAVDVKFAQDTLRGDNVTEIRMKFIKRMEENLPAGDE
ncbi:trafficking protein particle complex subunit 3 [Salvelinus sp. IW2-2015]|uniref:trafficking protein particle complex subunit 3 n=1 Tax=Salvelinus sp. IW2-2015 TaxID=2691554 RepID=UPI0038D48652